MTDTGMLTPRPMTAYPVDRPVRLHMPDGSSFMAQLIAVEGPADECWTWAEVEEGTAPADWCQGVCWGTNSEGKPSTRPIGWS